MRYSLFIGILILGLGVSKIQGNAAADDEEIEFDQDFAEFDAEFADEEDNADSVNAANHEQIKQNQKDEEEDEEANFDDEASVVGEDEDEDEEFNHFEDDEEFENFDTFKGDGDEFENTKKSDKKKDKSSTPPPPPKTINITKVPAHLRTRWENYILEIIMIFGIVVYVINFFNGKAKNQKIANAWFNSHKALLESNFALVGDDGSKNLDDIETQVQKEAEHIFTLWCSGRTCCEGMLVELKLLKRQDLVSVMSHMIKPSSDQIHVTVNMNPEDMDTFVFGLALKKTAVKMTKELTDLNTFCPERRSAEKHGVPSNYVVMSEIPEVTTSMLDSKMIAILNKYPDVIDSIHFSDQYTGPKPTDDQGVTPLPEGKKVLIFVFNAQTKNKKAKLTLDETMENLTPMMMLVFYFMDKIKRFRLTREGKNKADKNRSKVAEAFWKSIHAAKAEKAQEERERKRREIKERIREIEDPSKQRKLEDRENRRERKKAAPKMKQLKVKAM